MDLDIEYGLTDTGFAVPTYAELLDAVQTDYQRRWGNDIVLTANSNFGALSMSQAFFISKYYMQLQLVYYAAYVSTATGTSLDRLAANNSLSRNLAAQSQTILHIVTDEQYLIEAGTQFETASGVVFDVEDNVITEQQSDGTYSVDERAISDEYGSDTNVGAGTITIVTSPDESILSVTNVAETNGGSDDETDDHLRRRIIAETAANPSATINGIKTALMNVNGVREVNDIENMTDATDSYGNVPYSVHLYLLGGAKTDILAALAKYAGFGPLFVGSESGQVADVTGDMKTYYFDYATPVTIYADVSLKTNSNWDADSGKGEVQELLSEYVNELEMGANIILTKMYPDIYSIGGVDEATIMIGRSTDALGTTDIQLDKFEAPQMVATNITVEVS